MIIERNYMTQISIRDPRHIYNPEPVKGFTKILEDMYVGKIFLGCMVTEIHNVEMGQNKGLPDRPGGYVLVTLKCDIVGVRYDNYEIIPNAKVLEILKEDEALLDSTYGSLGLYLGKNLQFINVGDTLPVVCYESIYDEPMEKKIGISAQPFMPFKRHDVKFIISDIKDLSKVIAKFNKVKTKFDKVKDKQLYIKNLQQVKKQPKPY